MTINALWNLLVLASKQVVRHRTRSLLTLMGVGAGMFLFTTVETMQGSLRGATETEAGETTLIVYRENRFCPFTSRLPEYYLSSIERVPGVREAIPVQVVVNNCGASLDVITFRGVPADRLASYAPEIEVVDGSFEEWSRRSDAALVGRTFAQRRRLAVGDRFDAAGITVTIAGIIRSEAVQDNNVAYVHLDFLQQASRTGLGVVTQFNVKVAPGSDPDEVAKAIDERFASDSQPTSTRPEKAFFAQTARELVELVGFTRWLGLGAVASVLGLVGNSVLLVVRGRVRENAVLQTLGYPGRAIGWLVAAEGIVLGLGGGLVGVLGAGLFLRWQSFTVGNEGLTLAFVPGPDVIARGVVIALALGLVASLYPAWKAARETIVRSLRMT